MFKALYNHVNNITNKYYKFTTISYYIYDDRKKEKLKLRPRLQGGRVTLLPDKDSPGLPAKLTGRVILLPETTLRFINIILYS